MDVLEEMKTLRRKQLGEEMLADVDERKAVITKMLGPVVMDRGRLDHTATGAIYLIINGHKPIKVEIVRLVKGEKILRYHVGHSEYNHFVDALIKAEIKPTLWQRFRKWWERSVDRMILGSPSTDR